jgi:hypothetical protein
MGNWRVRMVTLKLSGAATTGSQDYVVSVDSEDGAAFDIILQSTEMVADGGTDIVWNVAEGFFLDGGNKDAAGDQLKVAFPNTDGKTYGLVAWVEKLR